MWVTLAFICTAAVFVGLTVATLHHQRWARRLPALEALPAPADGVPASAVRCSVIVAARDEEARLESTVRHLLAQRHIAVEVIVVDDRSTDGTSDIMLRLASEDARVRALRVDHLPDGWLGKCDEIKLGLLLHRAGKRTRAFLGGSDVECHWGTTVPNMMKIMEKNYFAAVDFRLAPVVAGAAFFALIFGASIIGLCVGTAAGTAAGLAPLTLALPAAIFARRLGWSHAGAAITLLLYPLLFFALVNSAVVTLRQGGVSWRDTFYSLDALRRSNVR
jgi:hypothetical protein